MKNWRKIDPDEYKLVWEKFYELFKFKPSLTEFPAIVSSLPQLKFDISKLYSDNKIIFNELEQIALDLFIKLSKPSERLYALNWQHDCYDFDPRLEMDRNQFDEWIVPILPNGDYYIFLTKDFKNVWFGHPWEMTITLIGLEIANFGRSIFSEIDLKK